MLHTYCFNENQRIFIFLSQNNLEKAIVIGKSLPASITVMYSVAFSLNIRVSKATDKHCVVSL